MEPWSAHLQGLRLVDSLLVFLPSSVIQLTRHGVLERVQDLFAAAWNPTFDGDAKAQMSQPEAQKKAVADTSNRCLAAARAARADAVDDRSSSTRAELSTLCVQIERGEESAVVELVALCCARDGITLYEFQEAELAGALLNFVAPVGRGCSVSNVDSSRMKTLSDIMAGTATVGESTPRSGGTTNGLDRVVDLLHGLLRVGDQLPLLLYGLPGAHGLSTLLKRIRLKFELVPGNRDWTWTQIGTDYKCNREIVVQSVTSMEEIRRYILEHAATSVDQEYLGFCEALVGCRIQQHYKAKASSYANVMSFTRESGEHTVIHEVGGNATRQVMCIIDFTIVRGRTRRSAAAAKRQVESSRQDEKESQQMLKARQKEDVAIAKARAEVQYHRVEARQRHEEEEAAQFEQHDVMDAEQSVVAARRRDRDARAHSCARVSLDEDEDGRWRLSISLQQQQRAQPVGLSATVADSEPPDEIRMPLVAPVLLLKNTGAVSVQASWTWTEAMVTPPGVDGVRLKLRSRGAKNWSVYDPASHCMLRIGSSDEVSELPPDSDGVMILALNPATNYEACLSVRCVDSGEWSEDGPSNTVYTGESIIPDPSAVWEWESGPGDFVEYDQESTTQLEERFTGSDRIGAYDWVIPGTETRVRFDLNRMIQTNENSGASRRVRRISDEVALKVRFYKCST